MPGGTPRNRTTLPNIEKQEAAMTQDDVSDDDEVCDDMDEGGASRASTWFHRPEVVYSGEAIGRKRERGGKRMRAFVRRPEASTAESSVTSLPRMRSVQRKTMIRSRDGAEECLVVQRESVPSYAKHHRSWSKQNQHQQQLEADGVVLNAKARNVTPSQTATVHVKERPVKIPSKAVLEQMAAKNIKNGTKNGVKNLPTMKLVPNLIFASTSSLGKRSRKSRSVSEKSASSDQSKIPGLELGDLDQSTNDEASLFELPVAPRDVSTSQEFTADQEAEDIMNKADKYLLRYQQSRMTSYNRRE